MYPPPAYGPLGLPIGSQIYPHRAMLAEPDGFARTCDALRRLGISHLELCSPFGYERLGFGGLAHVKETKAALDACGLAVVSSHFMIRELTDDLTRSLDWAEALGISQIVAPSLGQKPPEGLVEPDAVERAIDGFNDIAARCADRHLTAMLHNEWFEHARIGDGSGPRAYDRMLERLDPQRVRFQFQMSSVTILGSAAGYFEAYPGRFVSLHLQDLGPEGQVGIGQGTIDWTSTFAAASTGGVRNYYIEQTMDLTAQGVEFLGGRRSFPQI